MRCAERVVESPEEGVDVEGTGPVHPNVRRGMRMPMRGEEHSIGKTSMEPGRHRRPGEDEVIQVTENVGRQPSKRMHGKMMKVQRRT